MQRRALKLINGYKHINYTERLTKAGLISLENRRVRGDLIQMFKMSKNINLFQKMFKLNNSTPLRGNKFKIFKCNCKLNIRKYYFNNRRVNVWNKLPNNIVCSDSTNSFKNNLDKFDYFEVD